MLRRPKPKIIEENPKPAVKKRPKPKILDEKSDPEVKKIPGIFEITHANIQVL